MKIENKKDIIAEITSLTREMVATQDINTFDRIILAHEKLVAGALGYTRAKDLHFSDYWGEIKSLGAWGGDFVLVTSKRPFTETREYFEAKGFKTIIPFGEIVRT